MKWCRFQAGSSASYGLVEDETVIEVAGSPFAEYTATGTRHPLARVKLLPPVIPPVLYAAGPNYRGHLEGMAKRRGEPPRYPARPEPKLRSPHALIGTEENIVVPKECSGAVQPEGQLAVVIGKRARNVSRDEALDCVLGYSIGNDVSQREWQRTDRTLFRAQELRHVQAVRAVDRHRTRPRQVPHHRPSQRDGLGALLLGRPDLGYGDLASRNEQDRDPPSRRRALDGHRGRRRRHGPGRRHRGRDQRHRHAQKLRGCRGRVTAHTETPVTAHTETPVTTHTETPVTAHTET